MSFHEISDDVVAMYLNTTCVWNEGSTSKNSASDAWNEVLATANFRCDIILSSTTDSSLLLDLSNSPLLPCGVESLLLVENVENAFHKEDGLSLQVLFSQCFLVVDDAENDIANLADLWMIDSVTPSSLHWKGLQRIQNKEIQLDLTTPFERFNAIRERQLESELYAKNQNRNTLRDVVHGENCLAGDNNGAADSWEAALKQSIENEIHQMNLILTVLGVIFVFLILFTAFLLRKQKSETSRSFEGTPLSSSALAHSAGGSFVSSVKETSTAVRTTISPLCLPESPTYTKPKRILRPPPCISVDKPYIPDLTAENDHCSSSTNCNSSLNPIEQEQKRYLTIKKPEPHFRTVLAKCYRPSEGRFVLRRLAFQTSSDLHQDCSVSTSFRRQTQEPNASFLKEYWGE